MSAIGTGLSGLLLCTLVLALAGCTVVPATLSKEPFPAETVARVKVGETDQAQVREIFGEPRAIRLNGTFWFYGRSRPGAAVLAGRGAAVVDDYDWLALSFDASGRVSTVDQMERRSGCTPDGICLGGLADFVSCAQRSLRGIEAGSAQLSGTHHPC